MTTRSSINNNSYTTKMKQTAEQFLEKSIEVHEDNVKKGFWAPGVKRCEDEVDMLILSEAFEALEADREGKRADIQAFEETCAIAEANIDEDESLDTNTKAEEKMKAYATIFKSNIKDTVEDELADFCIRILDKAGNLLKERNEPIAAFVNETQEFFDFALQATSDSDNSTFSKFLANILRLRTIAVSPAALYRFAFKYAEDNNIDLSYHIEAKLQYNRTRAFKHGKQY